MVLREYALAGFPQFICLASPGGFGLAGGDRFKAASCIKASKVHVRPEDLRRDLAPNVLRDLAIPASFKSAL